MLSEFIVRKLTRLFNLMDANNSGSIELADYDQMTRNLAALYDVKPGGDEYKKLRRQLGSFWDRLQPIDTNHDGKISLEEWLAANARQHQPDTAEDFKDALAERAMSIFDLQDRDGDMRVTLDELQTYVRGCFGLGEAPWVAEAFKRSDVDGNGFITVEEVIRMEIEFHFSEDEEEPGNFLMGPL